MSHRAWMIAAALLLLSGLGRTDLWAPDEPRYAQVAEELRAMEHGAGGLVLLHLNGEVYAQKPPLYFWLAALLGAPWGRVTEVAARLPSALAGIATLWLAIRLGTRLLGPRTGVLGGALLLTSWEFAWRARRAQLDVLLTLFEVAALAAFWPLARGAPPSRRRLALLHGALGLAVLTKGPVGLLVPLLVIGCFLAWERRLAELPRLAPPWALALSVGPGLLWLAGAAALAPDGYLAEAVGTNLFGRFFAGTSHARPVYYYLYQFPLSFLPWTLLWPLTAGFARRRVFAPGARPERARAWRFLLAWVGASFVFFSLSAGKRALYLLPAFPAAALLCADAASAWLEGRARRPGRLAAGFVAAVLALELALFTLALPHLDAEKSPRPIAEAAAGLTAPGEPVGLLAYRTLVGGLVYYAGRPVVSLATPEDVAAFLADGGRAIVLRERDRGRVEALVAVKVRARARSGRRALLLVTPATRSGTTTPDADTSARGARESTAAEVVGSRPCSPAAAAPPWARSWRSASRCRAAAARRPSTTPGRPPSGRSTAATRADCATRRSPRSTPKTRRSWRSPGSTTTATCRTAATEPPAPDSTPRRSSSVGRSISVLPSTA